MQSFLVEGEGATLAVRTRAEGLLARLAHDLELAAAGVSGTATRDGDVWTADLSVPVASFGVVGVLHGEALDRAALSASDRAQIEQKMREDVFFGAVLVTASARGASLTRGEATMTIASRSQRVPLTLTVAPLVDGATRVTGRFTLSLDKLGARPIKGPLGAFRVKDAVEILFTIPLVSA